MGGIYIPRMEIPQEIWLDIRIYADGTVAIPTWHGWRKMPYSSAISAPDHGRLIDADEYQAKMKNAYDDDWFTVLEATPTVIPAEEEIG